MWSCSVCVFLLQMSGAYKVHAANLQPLYQQALVLAARFDSIQVQHVYRHLNAEADALANEAITDEYARGRVAGGTGY